ncbi:hypothetical protein D3C81_2079780 [compost metagenome]
MCTVSIGIGHDDDLGIIAVLYGKIRSDPCTDGGNNRLEFVVLKYIQQLGLL